ncbi:neutral ceramidase-like [Sarcoptes scabiei]|nr:neutral ceramidase-like [Sarcoptes scabiei]
MSAFYFYFKRKLNCITAIIFYIVPKIGEKKESIVIDFSIYAILGEEPHKFVGDISLDHSFFEFNFKPFKKFNSNIKSLSLKT